MASKTKDLSSRTHDVKNCLWQVGLTFTLDLWYAHYTNTHVINRQADERFF